MKWESPSFLDAGIVTEGTMSKLIVTILSAETTANRQIWSKAQPSIDKKECWICTKKKTSATAIAKQIGMGRSTAYKFLKDSGNKLIFRFYVDVGCIQFDANQHQNRNYRTIFS